MLGSFPISPLSCFLVSIACVLLVLNSMSWCFILQDSGHLIDYIVSFFQLTSGLCLTIQSCSKNISIPFRSVTAASSYSLCLLILISKSATLVTFPFFVLFALKTSNKKLISFVWILLSFTNCSLNSIYVHLKSTSILTLKFFPFFILTFAYIFNSFLELLYWLGIIYFFWEFTEIFKTLLFVFFVVFFIWFFLNLLFLYWLLSVMN